MKNYHVVGIALLAVAIASLAACDVRAAGGQVVTKFDCEGREVAFSPEGSIIINGTTYAPDTTHNTEASDEWSIIRFGDHDTRVVMATKRDTGETYVGSGDYDADLDVVPCRPVEFGQLDAAQ